MNPTLGTRPQTRFEDRVWGWLTRIYHTVVTPINFVTFLVSLYIIDNHYRARREQHQHHIYQHDSHDHGNGPSTDITATKRNTRPWLHRLLYYRTRPSSSSSSEGRSISNTTATATGTTAVHTSSSPPAGRNGVVITNKNDTSCTDPRSRAKSGRAYDKRVVADDGNKTWYYHSKQKKLFKMEAADAFALRQSVLAFLIFVGVAGGWLIWRMVAWIYWFLLTTIW
ncbi:hypothetical protein F5Y17DRAFT_425053 [Xylariaceae sp. FL0594]|nr:hypothetical protein F5Y17DRAFT_425053 [Xylariaceae sp. FL0594]